MPTNKYRYPPEWRDRIRPRILRRADHKCESCKVPNNALIMYDKSGAWLQMDDHMLAWANRNGHPVTRVTLTIAHVNQIVTDNRDDNLRAWCQKCHISHDAPFKAFMRKMSSVWDVNRLIDASHDTHGASILPHMFAVSRAKLREYQTIEGICKKRGSRQLDNDYDRSIVERSDQVHSEYARLNQRICEMLVTSYGVKNPSDFFKSYCKSELRIIGGAHNPLSHAQS